MKTRFRDILPYKCKNQVSISMPIWIKVNKQILNDANLLLKDKSGVGIIVDYSRDYIVVNSV